MNPHESADSDERIVSIADLPDGAGSDMPPAPDVRLPNLFSYPLINLDPDPENGVSIPDFIEHLAPDLRRRLCRDRDDPWSSQDGSRDETEYAVDDKNLGAISVTLRQHLHHLRDHWSEIDNAQLFVSDVVLRLILEKTEPGQDFELKYLQPRSAEESSSSDLDRGFDPPPSCNAKYWWRHFGGEWVPFPPIMRARIKQFGSVNLGAPRCIDAIASTIDVGGERLELAVFAARSPTAPQTTSANRGGRPPKYVWEDFHNEITRIALIEGELPDRPELHRRMLEWCAKNWPDQPEESEIRKRLARLYNTPGIRP